LKAARTFSIIQEWTKFNFPVAGKRAFRSEFFGYLTGWRFNDPESTVMLRMIKE
jgi:hypothetical protein